MELIMYHLVEVKTRKQEDEFLRIPVMLYEVNEETNWVSPLFSDTKAFFDPVKNPLLRDGESCRWLLYDVNKHLIGRIAAFYWKQAENETPPMGYFGFFECADDKRGAERLFKVAIHWLVEKGMKGMWGPFHLGGPGFFTGSLVRGFYEPAYGVPYNFSFYNDLFLNYGFREVSKYCTYRILLTESNQWKFVGKQANSFYKDARYRIEFFDPKRCKEFSDDFVRVFNKVWAGFPGMAPMTGPRAVERCKMLRLIREKRTILFLYFQDKPVGFLITVPDIHQIIRKFKGKYNLLDRLFLWFAVKVFRKVTALSGLIYAVDPDHREKGLEAALLHSLHEIVTREKLRFSELKMSRIGQFEPHMKKVVQQLDGKLYHQYVTYQILFDELPKNLEK